MSTAAARERRSVGSSRRTGGGSTAVLCAPRLELAANPATVRTLMLGADGGTRERLAEAIQHRHGNGALQRLLDPGSALPIQRWAVGLPRGTADCDRIVSYLNANSPHRADSGWAKTRVRFSWGGDPVFSETAGAITATVGSPRVTRTTSVDMPEWSPTNPAVVRGWTSMYGNLRAHEGEHERIGREWEERLRTRLSSLTVTVTRRTVAAFNAAVQAEWNAWLAEHQADQRAIDPYTALLDCSGGEEQTEGAETGVEGAPVGAAEE